MDRLRSDRDGQSYFSRHAVALYGNKRSTARAFRQPSCSSASISMAPAPRSNADNYTRPSSGSCDRSPSSGCLQQIAVFMTATHRAAGVRASAVGRACRRHLSIGPRGRADRPPPRLIARSRTRSGSSFSRTTGPSQGSPSCRPAMRPRCNWARLFSKTSTVVRSTRSPAGRLSSRSDRRDLGVDS